MKKLYLTLIGIFIYLATDAFPCKKYVFDSEGNVMKGKLKITWIINTGFNNCGFPSEEISKHKFVVWIKDVFEEKILIKDTIDESFYFINTNLYANKLVVFYFTELGNNDHIDNLNIIPRREEWPSVSSKIDTLNFYLSNGYFFNATPLLDEMGKNSLINELREEYKILFPDHYPDERTYFNSYLDSSSLRLVKMPFVNGLSPFIDTINELTRNEPVRSKGFKVFANISEDGKLSKYEVIPVTDKQIFDKAVHHLTFTNHLKMPSDVVIIVMRSSSKKRFVVVNERALIDQRSLDFKKKFPYRGAIH